MRTTGATLIGVAILATSCSPTYRALYDRGMDRGSAAALVADYSTARAEFDSAINTADMMPSYYRRRQDDLIRALYAAAALADQEERWSDADAYQSRLLEILKAVPEAGTFSRRPWKTKAFRRRLYRGQRRALVHLGRIDEANDFHALVLQIPLFAAVKRAPYSGGVEARFGQELADAGHYELAVAAFERCEVQDGLNRYVAGAAVADRLESYATALDGVGREEDATRARLESDSIRGESDYVQHVLWGKNPFQAIAAYWPKEKMPLHVQIERPTVEQVPDPAAAIEIARSAVLAWADAVESGIPSFVFVTPGHEKIRDPEIVIRWRQVEHGQRWLGRCNPDAEWQDDPLQRSDVDIVSRALGQYQPESHLRFVLVHEIGHALGLLGHSSLKTDIMYASRIADPPQHPSARDFRTLRRLYEQKLGQGYRH